MKNQLTANFSLDEFTRWIPSDLFSPRQSECKHCSAQLAYQNRSATATTRGICNEAPVEVISNLQNLCQQVLQPLRDHLGVPVVITSGYRCRALNRLVGGVPNSQHIKGEAADIVVRSTNGQLTMDNGKSDWRSTNGQCDLALMREAFEWIRAHCVFDQLIWEEKKGKTWIHVSCKRRMEANRRNVIRSKAEG